jgi:hypothetical protein
MKHTKEYYDTERNKPLKHTKDKINPEHYTQGIECIDYITSKNMNFLEGNVVKYVTRYRMKNGLEDLEKAKWYLDRLIRDYNKREEDNENI